MAKAMIVSVGGSPDPLRKSIMEHKPEHIIFFASHESVPKEAEILKDLEPRPKIETEITDNPNSLHECYKAARRCIDRLVRCQIDESDVVVDYTGGTKVMSAALLIATMRMKCGFNYVGGDLRTKDGLGIVVDGHEKMYADMNPWSVFAEEERRQVTTLFNARRYSAVLQIVEICKNRRLPIEIEKYFNFVEKLAMALLFWDQFQHQAASRYIKEAIKSLEEYHKFLPDRDLEESLKMELVSHADYLESLRKNTEDFTKYDLSLVKDIVNNARRRIEDKRYDDAAARLYRALEMYGQIYFKKEFNVPNDKVRPENLPRGIRDEFVRKYQDNKTQLLKLPLHATFIALRMNNNVIGKRYEEFESKIRTVQSNRNNSILAHGIRPVSENAIKSILSTVEEFMSLDPEKDYFDFPQLPNR